MEIGNEHGESVWSVLKAQIVIKAGIRHRVGSGLSVNIMENPRLPDVDNAFVITKNDALKGITVLVLFETGKNSWDVDLRHDMFERREVNLILLIPLGRNEGDNWFCSKERIGNYSMKSAY
ncbi:uncharacterized protein LOC141689858 [Apium graveolens]|uniref:uncharacterized protein LOC141689858 n=1 Tax=Apium graveolens TaxID=4045 RepID=UPI003D7AED32